MAVVLAGSGFSSAADLVTLEAESADTLGSDFSVNGGTPTYITILTDGGGESPSNSTRVASYTVIFPTSGTYKLYGRVRVGPTGGGGSDDSFFYGNGFGIKSASTAGDWIRVNNVNTGGFTNPGDTVSGSGSAGVSVWKWINLSDYTGSTGETPISFTVTAGNLTNTFQIGARENGFDMDKFAFGTSGTAFTVADLDNGTPPSPPTNVFVGPEGIALHRFSPLNNGINADGANPAAGLALFGDVLCGTTLNGGLQGDGTVFYMSADGSNFVASHSFSNAPNAANPQGELAAAGNGLFSTSFGGGSNGVGTVFVTQTNGGVSVLRSFSGVYPHTATNSGGASPTALLAISGDKVYGTATAGGTAANGSIFSLTTNGATFSVLHNFSILDSQTGTNADGAVPWGGLILSGNKLYGTASGGGAGGNGVVFSIRTIGADFTTLYSFSPSDTLTATNADGAIPMAGLVLLSNTLYGTTLGGGNGGRGTVFSIQTNGTAFTVLHHFPSTDPITGTNSDGAAPVSALIISNNVLYGTASAGGAGAAGTVFSLSLGSTQFNTVHSFGALTGNGTNADGAFPVAPVLRVGNSLYGTTFSGGPGAAGAVFSLSLSVPAPPAIITNITLNPDGTVTLYFLGGPDSTNIVQAAFDLTQPIAWQNVSTNVADGSGAWQLTNGNNAAIRFYRSYAQ